MVRIDGNGRDGGGRREDIPLIYSPSFHFFYFSLFLSFSPSFFLASFFFFITTFFPFSKILQNFKKIYTKQGYGGVVSWSLKRVCQNVKCNV